MESFDHGILLDVAEKPLHAALPREGQAADGMTAALQRTAEGGNTGKVGAGQVNIRREHHGAAAAPAVQAAVLCQGHQLVGGGHLHRNGFFPLGADRRCQQTRQHTQAQHRREKAFSSVFHTSSPSV